MVDRVRSDAPIRRPRLRVADPFLGLEADWAVWATVVAVGLVSFTVLFWAVFGLLQLVGGSFLTCVALGGFAGVGVGGVLAAGSGWWVASMVSSERPLASYVSTFVREWRGPKSHSPVVRRRVPSSVPGPGAGRRVVAPLPSSFDLECGCVRPGCLEG